MVMVWVGGGGRKDKLLVLIQFPSSRHSSYPCKDLITNADILM